MGWKLFPPGGASCSGNPLDFTQGQRLRGKCLAQQGAPDTLLVFVSSRRLLSLVKELSPFYFLFSFFFFSFYGHTRGIWKFLGYGSNWSCSCQPTPQPQHGIQAIFATYTTAHGNAGSFNPMSKARDQTHICLDTSWVYHLLSHNRNSPCNSIFNCLYQGNFQEALQCHHRIRFWFLLHHLGEDVAWQRQGQ